MTKEEKEASIKALLEERRGYLTRGEDERVAAVDAELKRLGAGAETASKKATRRPSSRARSKR